MPLTRIDKNRAPNDTQKAVEMVGGSQFELILIAAERARELKHGSTPKVSGGHGAAVTALLEVEKGLYTKKDFMNKIHKGFNNDRSDNRYR